MQKVAAILLGGLITLGATSPKPVFEYKGYRAGEVVSAARLQACSPKPSESSDQMSTLFSEWQRSQALPPPDTNIVTCSDPEAKLAGYPVNAEYISLYKGQLTSVTVHFDAAAYDGVTKALRAKYGSPCRTSTKQLQNRFGAKVASASMAWCFATGELAADMYYPNLVTSTVAYTDRHQPPSGKPKVDF